jgi:hypothetical protein
MTAKTKKMPGPALIADDTDNEEELTGTELHAEQNDETQDGATDSADDRAAANGIASTPVDLARFGLNQIAYVRQTTVDGQPVWSIYSAMGHPLSAALTLDQAWGAVLQNNLQPVFVH